MGDRWCYECEAPFTDSDGSGICPSCGSSDTAESETLIPESEVANLRRQLAQMTQERDEAVKLNVADEWKLQCTLAENRPLLSDLEQLVRTLADYVPAWMLPDLQDHRFPLTAAEVERVKRLERIEDKARTIYEYNSFESMMGKMGAELDAALAEGEK